jgi:uncharacterized membrane protein YphA (DoxX/SURF4 family)
MSQFPPPPVPGAPAGMPVKPHRGGMILAFGIIGILCCFIFAILAWVMGKNDLKEMAAGRMDRTGEGMTKAGKIMGMISVILAIVGIVIWTILLIAGVATLNFSANAGS